MRRRLKTAPSSGHRLRQILTVAFLAVSGLGVFFGFRLLVAFEQTPGAAGRSPHHWPSESRVPRSKGRPELLLFVHEYCSCSVATLRELARIPARQQGASPVIHVLFYRPPRGSEPETESATTSTLWNQARALKDAQASWDEDGREARLFGAGTSGYVLLYGARGDLLFSGGVTSSRGHEGDNAGLDLLISTLNTGRPANRSSFVFGCALGGASDLRKAGSFQTNRKRL